MSRWWRAYDEALHDPKLMLLSDKIFRAWFNVMCIASVNGGVLPAIKVVAVQIRTNTQRAAAIITELHLAGLLDKRDDGTFEPHNWKGRQYQSDVKDPTAANRQRNYRDRKRNADRNATVTEPVTVTPPRVQNTDTEKKDAAAPPSDDQEKQLFERGKQVLGQDAGGLIAKLLKAKGKNIAAARAVIETASNKQKPREYVGGVLRGQGGDDAAQFKQIEEVMRKKGSAVVFATEIEGRIPGVDY